MIVGNKGYIANVGDSRALMSAEWGQFLYKLSRDHKPNEPYEKERIEKAGGSVYQSKIIAKPPFAQYHDFNTSWTRIGLFPNKPLVFPEDCEYVLVGPYRVQPGRLSVSRTIGDAEAKIPKYGGVEGIIIWEPDIKEFEITESWDFVILACDGIFDKMENMDVLNVIWDSINTNSGSIHQLTGYWVESILRNSLANRTLDNITVVMVSFKSLKKTLSKLQKVKCGRKPNEIDELFNKENIDIGAGDIDEDYMKEILKNWRESDSEETKQKVAELNNSQRDLSVPPFSRPENVLSRIETHNKRYHSNIKNRGNYYHSREKSQIFENPNYSEDTFKKPFSGNNLSFGSRKFSNDIVKDYHSYRTKFKRA